MRKISIIMALALILCGAFALSAQAGPILDFDISPLTPGTISYTANGVLNGQNIQVDTVTGLGTPLNSGVPFPITGGLLFFETGPFTAPGSGELDFSVGNGFLHINGGVPAAGIPAGSQLIFNTALTSPPVPHVALGTGNLGGTVFLNFTDEKNADLVKFFGLTGLEALGGTLNLQFATSKAIDPTGNTGFDSSTVLSGDVSNNFVPIPPTAILLGSGLLGLVGFRLRRKA